MRKCCFKFILPKERFVVVEEHKRCINDFNFCISLIKDYNAKVKSKHRIPIAFFENVSQVIKKLKMDWLQEPFIDFIKSISESLPKQDDYKLVANTYGITCPNCKVKDNIYAETIQARSSDEASDRLLKCLSCGYQWKISGG